MNGGGTTLEKHLAQWAEQGPERTALDRTSVAATRMALAGACRRISDLISAGALAGALGATRAEHGAGDAQKELDVIANDFLLNALLDAPVAALASEEMDNAVPLEGGGPLLVAVDPLDGSSNIDTNVSVGTIFSLLPAPSNGAAVDTAAFLQPGTRQLAAGYALYGPQTSLVLTTGDGTHVFTLDRRTAQFKLTGE